MHCLGKPILNSLQFLANSWNPRESSYREDLGFLVAWNSAIKTDKSVAPKLLDALDTDKTKYLLALSGYPDQTMRWQAGSLLVSLAQAPPSEQGQKSQDFFEQVLETVQDPQEVIQSPSKGISYSTNLIGYAGLSAVKSVGCSTLDDSKQRKISEAIESPKTRVWLALDPKATALVSDIENKHCQ